MRRGLRDGKLTFGKYRDVALTAVPWGYLGWLIDDGLVDEYTMREAVLAEMRRRVGAAPPPGAVPSLRVPPTMLEAARLLVDTGYRAAARSHHPDHGGDTAQMQQINVAAAWLREQLRG